MPHRSAAFRWLLLVALCAAVPVAGARDFKVDPGDVPELRPDEGYLVVAVDSDMPVRSLVIRSDDRAFADGKLDGIGEGSTMGLYVLPAGTYRWDRLNVSWLAWNLRKDPEGRFTVEAGKINYAGDLVYRDWVSMHVANRSLRVLDWLDREHPRIVATHAFSYRGSYPDPFPAFYRERLAAADAPRRPDTHQPLPAAGPLPIPVRELWKTPRIYSVALNPGAPKAAVAVREDVREFKIELYDLAGESVSTIADSAGSIDDLQWVADDILAAYVETMQGKRQMFFRFAVDGSVQAHTMDRVGFVVDTLPGDEDEVVFASRGSRGEPVLHRIDVRDTAALAKFRYTYRDRLNAGLSDDFAWVTDAAGVVRAALVRSDGATRMVWGTPGNYATVLEFDERDVFTPSVLSADGSTLFGLSEEGRDQQDLVEFDPRQRRIVRTVFSRPGVDIVETLVDDRREPIGVRYYEGGRLVSEYFDTVRQERLAKLAGAFPGRTVALLDGDRAGRRMLIGVDGSDQPMQVYHVDVASSRAGLLDESAPWLAKRRFAPTHTLKVRAADGLELEAFLTLPEGSGRRPLVVMPHGGPIGIADRRHFDPEVQFIASLGYAVLQVNFRGSAGYGVKFREAGYRAEGTGIEDDIDAAIRAALAAWPLDPERMCVVGSSYGGQSGLSLAVRAPDRFRCIVSMSGVSDRILFFTASDSGRRKEGRAELEKIIGDPNTQLEQMVETSPLFRYETLTTPVMLVHGAEDIRVDYEHTRRLVRMLNLAGRPPVLLELPDEAHGIVDMDNLETAWEGIAGFLRQHLEGRAAKPATVAAPTASAAAAAAAD